MLSVYTLLMQHIFSIVSSCGVCVCQINKTLSELEQKEEMARQELQRVEAQRERRRQIKEVRYATSYYSPSIAIALLLFSQ